MGSGVLFLCPAIRRKTGQLPGRRSNRLYPTPLKERSIKHFRRNEAMKNIYEILKDYGLEIPEEKKADFDKSWKENYRTKNEYDKAVNQRDEYKTSLDTVNEKLKEFDGVDVADLKGQITKLQDDLKTQKETYDAKEAERVFTDSVRSAIKEAGGRNAKAVMALLDMDALRESKDQSADIKKALDAAKESDAYLFGSDEPFRNPVGPSGGNGGTDSALAAMRAAAGLPPAESK